MPVLFRFQFHSGLKMDKNSAIKNVFTSFLKRLKLNTFCNLFFTPVRNFFKKTLIFTAFEANIVTSLIWFFFGILELQCVLIKYNQVAPSKKFYFLGFFPSFPYLAVQWHLCNHNLLYDDAMAAMIESLSLIFNLIGSKKLIRRVIYTILWGC